VPDFKEADVTPRHLRSVMQWISGEWRNDKRPGFYGYAPR